MDNTKKIIYSLVIPVYGNEENIPYLIPELQRLEEEFGELFEVVFVIDASPDNSKKLILSLANGFAYQMIEHSRNFGSFVAIRTGIEYARGEYIAVMAADLQEPPSLIADFFRKLKLDDADILFGQRESRNDPWLKTLFSDLYWSSYKKFIEPSIPKGGVDIFAINKKAKGELLKIEEPNSSLIAQLFWLGFRRKFVPYKRRKREQGESAWGFSRRIKYMIDSVFSYSDLPIMFILWFGLFSLLTSSIAGIVTITAKILGFIEVPGYAATILVILFLGAAIIFIQGVIGCYLWRAFENTKKRPLSIVTEAKLQNKE